MKTQQKNNIVDLETKGQGIESFSKAKLKYPCLPHNPSLTIILQGQTGSAGVLEINPGYVWREEIPYTFLKPMVCKKNADSIRFHKDVKWPAKL